MARRRCALRSERLIEQSKVGLILGSYASSRAGQSVRRAKRGASARAMLHHRAGYQPFTAPVHGLQLQQVSQVHRRWLAPVEEKAFGEGLHPHEDSEYGTSVADSFKNAAGRWHPAVSVEPLRPTPDCRR
jgi:hypothetical protein